MGTIRRKGPVLTLMPVFLLLAILLSSGCAGLVPSPRNPGPASPTLSAAYDNRSWMNYPLTDLAGKGNFSVNAFPGKTVLVPVVSTACPTCIVQLVRQLDEIDRLSGVHDGSIVVVSLDLDPADGPGFIATYANRSRVSGYSARSPTALTLQVLDTFGPFSIGTDTIPVILVCPDGYARLLPAGLKTTAMLNATLAEEC